MLPIANCTVLKNGTVEQHNPRRYPYSFSFVALLLFLCSFVHAADNPLLLPPTISITSNNPTCGKQNGSIVASATGGTAPYTYRLNTGTTQTSGVFTLLGPATYTITVTDAANQTATTSVTLINLFAPPTSVSTQYTLPSGCTSEDATLTLGAIGGTPPYTYSIDRTNFQASNVFKNLSAGAYICAVKDANGCLNPYIWWNTTNVPERCVIRQNGQNRTFICGPFRSYLGLMGVSGGTAPYQYSLDGINFQTDRDFFPLPGGLYTVTVKDATNSLMKYSVAIYDECVPLLTVAAVSKPANCSSPDGSIAVTAVDGTAPYQYSIDGVNYHSSGQFTGLIAGNYTVFVKDANNLVSSKLVIVPLSCLTINASATSSTCGNANGSISIQSSGGAPPYTYSLDGVNFQTSSVFSNLTAGTYTVTVKDAANGTGTFPVTLSNIAGPGSLSLNSTPKGCRGATGSITAAALGGTAPLQYSLNGGAYQTSATFSNLTAGSYQVTVKDANGCVNTSAVNVQLTNDLVVNAGNDITICEGDKTVLMGNSNASTFSWSPSVGLSNPGALQSDASPVVTTAYVLTATQGGCTRKDTVTVAVNKAPTATTAGDTTICFGTDLLLSGNGGLTFVWSPANYLDNPSLQSPVFTPPSKGAYTYTLHVKDALGCTSLNKAVSNVSVIEPRVDAGRDTTIAANRPLQLTANDPSGVGFVSYVWSPSTWLSNANTKSPIATVDHDIAFTVKATTASGCIATDVISLKVYKGIDIFVPTAFTPNGDGKNDVLQAVPIGIKQFGSFSVFNRWGEMVFQTKDPGKGWNGKINGVLQRGVFVWIAEGVDYLGNTIKRKGTTVVIQ